MEDNYREIKKAEPCLKLIHMDQVEVEEIEWLFIPSYHIGKVTIIPGRVLERGRATVVVADHSKINKRRSNIK